MSRRAWARCPVCGAQVDDLAEHQQRHANVDQRTQDAWAEACAAKETATNAAARADAAAAAAEALIERVEALVTQVEQSQAAAEQNRAEIANLKARNPAQPPAKGQNSGG